MTIVIIVVATHNKVDKRIITTTIYTSELILSSMTVSDPEICLIGLSFICGYFTLTAEAAASRPSPVTLK
ncbi:hypothetical protein D3C75_1202960 [compost metagenome]